MTMTDPRSMADWRGRDVVDDGGDKIGRLEEIYLDDDTGRPEWLAVRTGFFGTHVSLVPLAGAAPRGDTILVPFSKDKVKGAPHFDLDGHLDAEEETTLYEYYGRHTAQSGTALGTDAGHDTSGPNTDTAMTRSEEQLRVGKTTREAGRARLRKWVETEHVTKTVPVAHEEVRVTREPITDANIDKAMDGPAISEEEHEVVLHEEQAVAQKEVVPKERVRLEKDVVTGEAEVSDELRKERIDMDGPGTGRRTT